MDYIYVLLLQFKFILFSFSINLLLFPTVKNSHWSNYFTKMDDVDFYSQLSLIYMYSRCTECVDKVRYLPSVKSFTWLNFFQCHHFLFRCRAMTVVKYFISFPIKKRLDTNIWNIVFLSIESNTQCKIIII